MSIPSKLEYHSGFDRFGAGRGFIDFDPCQLGLRLLQHNHHVY